MSTAGTLLTETPAPGSPAWYRYMTASKIAAVMDHSPYDSYLSLWLRMAGDIPAEPMDDTMRRGHYLEPAIVAWFKDQHPDWTVEPTGMWIHPHYRWAGGTPDGAIHLPNGETRGLEAKSSDLEHEWGEEGTNQVPPAYYDQTQWQMFVTGWRVVHLAVILPHFRFAEYVIEYDREHVKTMVTAAVRFMQSLLAGQRPKLDPLDGHTETYKALRTLAPGITEETVQVEPDLAIEYVNAVTAAKDAAYRETAAKSQLAEAMGEARAAVVGKLKLAGRQSRGGGTPYLVAARNLPTPEQIGDAS